MLWLVVHAALPSLLLQQPATVLPAAFRAPEHAVRRCSTPLVMADAPVDKQMSSDKIITFAGQPDDMKALIEAALKRLDRNRAMQGKPKHETVDAMISSYVEEAAQAGLGWTREEAESEVCITCASRPSPTRAVSAAAARAMDRTRRRSPCWAYWG